MSVKDHIESFLQHLETLEITDEKGEDGYFKEYTKLRQLTQHYRAKQIIPTTEGKKECNIKKNRYKDIVPFDATRVKLSEVEGVEGSDYLNANFVKGVSGHSSYIAAQGPLPPTVVDFVRMLWEYSIRVIIMACNEYEANKHKCQRYWPLSLDEELTFGQITIKMQSETERDGEFVERILTLHVEGEEERTISHFHYIAWPDHGIPTQVASVLDVIAEARVKQRSLEAPPIVVHCSAGCGRTGTILAIDYVWGLLKYGRLNKSFKLFEVVKSMRQQRPSIVQSPEQYIFLHYTIRNLFDQHLSVMQQNIYENMSINTTVNKKGDQEEDGVYQDVGVANGKKEPSPIYEAPTSIMPKTPCQLAIEETVDKMIDMELNKPPTPDDYKPPTATKPPPSPTKPSVPKFKPAAQTTSASEDDNAIYAAPLPPKRTELPKRPPKPANYENMVLDQAPPVPPKTQASSILEDNEESKEPRNDGYINTKSIPVTRQPKAAPPSSKPSPPSTKPPQRKISGGSGIKPDIKSSKPKVDNHKPDLLTSIQQQPAPHKNLISFGAEYSEVEVIPPAVPETARPNVSRVNIRGSGSEIVDTNRESSLSEYSLIGEWSSGAPEPLLEDYGAISDWNSGTSNIPPKPVPNLPKAKHYEEMNTNDYSLEQATDEDRNYAYAGSNAESKWSLQHYALNKPSQTSSTYEDVNPAEPTYMPVEGDLPDDVFNESVRKSMRYDVGEGSDEATKTNSFEPQVLSKDGWFEDRVSIGSGGLTMTSGKSTMPRAWGALFKRKAKFSFDTKVFGHTLGSSSSASPTSAGVGADPFEFQGPPKIVFKSADISFPRRVKKPVGKRTPVSHRVSVPIH